MSQVKTDILSIILVVGFLSLSGFCNASGKEGSTKPLGVRKVKDIIIYEDPQYYSAFPSVIKTAKQDFIVAFRRAPDRRIFGEKGNNHVDPNSYLVSVRSYDGEIWTKELDLIHAHPFGGSQDPCLLKLQDGTLLCTSYGRAFVRSDGTPNLRTPYVEARGAFFLGGYLVRSLDNGKTWEGPIYPSHVDDDINFNALGDPMPAYNRGALCEAKNGRIFWVVAVSDSIPVKKTSNHLIVSDDKGLSWQYSGLVASDDKVSFNETSIYETPKGDLVAFLRTANFDDQVCIARSTDGGKTFKWESMGFQGHPLNALRLPDNRVLLTYGYRLNPMGFVPEYSMQNVQTIPLHPNSFYVMMVEIRT